MQTKLPILKNVESFNVIGLHARTKNGDEFNELTAKLPKLWQQFYSTDLIKKTAIYGVYSNYESDATGFYTATVGIASDNHQAPFHSVKIHTGSYLVFQGKGTMPSTVIETWKHVWDYFETESKYQRNFMCDFEMYSGQDEVAIYIGIK